MKNLIIALTLFVSLLIFGSLVVTRSIEAQKADVLTVLLQMPRRRRLIRFCRIISASAVKSFTTRKIRPPITPRLKIYSITGKHRASSSRNWATTSSLPTELLNAFSAK